MRQEELIPLIREFPDRSIRWLLETPDNVRGLLLAMAADLAERIDYAQLRRLDRTFIPDSFRKREADMVFMAPGTMWFGTRDGVSRSDSSGGTGEELFVNYRRRIGGELGI